MTSRIRSLAVVLLAGLMWIAVPGHPLMGQDGDFGGMAGSWYGEADYLIWWVKGNRVPALVSTSPNGTSRSDAGVLGTPGASVLFGDERIDDNYRSGGRIRIGRWLSDVSAVQLEYFGLGDGANNGNYFNSSTGDPILARPFFNADPNVNGEDSQLIAFPNVIEGSIRIRTGSEMHSVNLLLRRTLREGPRGRLQVLGGYRYLRFRESLNIREDLTVTEVGGPTAQGTTFDIDDWFTTENDFHGADFGLSLSLWGERWQFDSVAKLGVGGIRRQLAIDGRTVTTVPGFSPATAAGGLLAQPTNIGTYNQTEFALLPELDLSLGYRVSDRATLVVGYTLLYLTNTFRTGDQIDRVVNATQLGGGALNGPARPAAPGSTTSLWAQGLHVGLTFER